jgi:hypothetical protein
MVDIFLDDLIISGELDKLSDDDVSLKNPSSQEVPAYKMKQSYIDRAALQAFKYCEGRDTRNLLRYLNSN